VCVVQVCEVVGVQDLRTRRPQQLGEVLDHLRGHRIADHPARVVEQHLRAVATLSSRGNLLLTANPHQVAVREVGVPPGAGRPGSVAHHDATEPPLIVPVAPQDAVDREDLEVVGVGADTHMGGAFQGHWSRCPRTEMNPGHRVGETQLSAHSHPQAPRLRILETPLRQ